MRLNASFEERGYTFEYETIAAIDRNTIAKQRRRVYRLVELLDDFEQFSWGDLGLDEITVSFCLHRHS